jgi:hypothetical protein
MRRIGLVLLLTAAIAGCGGDKGVTRADYIAEATDVCKRFSSKARDLTDRLQHLGDEAHSQDEVLAKAVPVLEEGLEIQRDQLAAIRKIEPPEDDRDTIDKILTEIETENDMIEEVVDAARERDAERYTTLGEDLSETEDRIWKMLRDYGFKQCQ